MKKRKNDSKNGKKQTGGFIEYWNDDENTRRLFLKASFVLGNKYQNRGNNVFYNTKENFNSDERCLQMIGSFDQIMTFQNDITCIKNNIQSFTRQKDRTFLHPNVAQ